MTAFGPAYAQDHYGAAVAVDGDRVLVLKPSPGHGPPSIQVLSRGEVGDWEVIQEIDPVQIAGSGSALSGSMSLAGGTLLVAGGDPDGRVGAVVLARNEEAAWASGSRIELAGGEVDDDAPVDLMSVFRILQPPARRVATDGRAAVIAVVGGAPVPGAPASPGAVWVVESRNQAGWSDRVPLAAEGVAAADRFGAAVAIAGSTAFVGAPRRGSGVIHVFERDGEDGWRHAGTIDVAGLAESAGFGEAIAATESRIAVGAPGGGDSEGFVVIHERTDDGGWRETGRLSAPNGSMGDGFGTAVAISGDEMWIGAPGADEGRGRIYRTSLSDPDTQVVEIATPADAGPGFGLGRAVALGESAAVVGAPGADGTAGRALAFRRAGSEWTEGVWLTALAELDPVVGEEVRCSDSGAASGFACRDVDLLAFLPVSSIGGGRDERVSDLWGWTDPETRREYALVGRTGGAAFVDVSDPSTPRYLGFMPANRSGARDLKVYRDHLFMTGDGAGEHGLLVFDLGRLRDAGTVPGVFEPDARYDGIQSAHNLIIDTESGFAFAVGATGGAQTCGGGLHMVDIREPLAPVFAGCYVDRATGLIWQGRTHDAQCTVYMGPDAEHHGKQICLASNETALRIVDVTDKETPIEISMASYPGVAYAHQGWLTEDQRYFYLDDELDELVGRTERTRTLVWDLSDLDDPVVASSFEGPDGATDHNLYVKGDRMYQANYQAGMRVVDISDPEAPVEVGFFDTTPYGLNPAGFQGAWTAFPFFESGSVLVSSMYEGLFILRPRRRELVP